MARPLGSRSQHYDVKRATLVRRCADVFLEHHRESVSLSQLAKYVGVSQSTLRHYFGARDGLVIAVLASFEHRLATLVDDLARPQGSTAEEMVGFMLRRLVAEWETGELGAIAAVGQREGAHHPEHGPLYVKAVHEPLLQATANGMAQAAALTGQVLDDPRRAALNAFGPVWIWLVQRDHMSMSACSPHDLSAFLDAQSASIPTSWRAQA